MASGQTKGSMPIQKPRAKTARKSGRKIPEGLHELVIDTLLPFAEVDTDRLNRWSGAHPNLATADDATVVGFLASDAEFPHCHGHVSLTKESAQKRFRLNVLVFATRSRSESKKPTLTISEFFESFAQTLKNPAAANRGVVSGTFYFKQDQWNPIFQLPFAAPPAAVGNLPGLPQIVGFDFEFPEPSPQQPLIRAFVSTFPTRKEFIVRVMLGFSALLSGETVTRLMDYAAENVKLFVKPVETPDV